MDWKPDKVFLMVAKKSHNPLSTKGPDRLPGDPSKEQLIERMIRVDHAGEYGAVRIYEGQLAVLAKDGSNSVISHMLDQEKNHLATFDNLISERRVRLLCPCGTWLASHLELQPQ